LRSFLTLLTLCALTAPTAPAQNRHDWQQATARLHPGDKLHVSLKTGAVDATFLSSTPQDLTADSGAMKKEDILRIERLQSNRHGSRSKHVLIGAGIGAAAGIAIGFAINLNSYAGTASTISGGVWGGAIVGGLIGALLPARRARPQTIYSAP
jgi:hypothetical protein